VVEHVEPVLLGPTCKWLAVSHFSERVRWVLDAEGMRYSERRLLPGVHVLTTRRLAPTTSVPLLRHPGGVVQGSGAILDYVATELGATGLLPPDRLRESAELEALAERAFGRPLQRILYEALLERRGLIVALWSLGGPSWAAPFYAVAYPTMARAVRRMYRVEPGAVAASKQRLREAVHHMDLQLAHQPYLTGSTPVRADVTLAALLAPLCMPPEHPVPWAEYTTPSLRDFAREFEGGATWNHVLVMYREHRRPRAASARP
jgi:glutathione S-transferase